MKEIRFSLNVGFPHFSDVGLEAPAFEASLKI